MAKSAKILVVDDEEIVCRGCSRALSAEGHQVDVTQRPLEGLRMASETPYDLIILDLKMPEIDGMEFLRRVKEVRPETEVVIMTGFAQIETAVEAMKLGAFDYIPKPFGPDQLIVTTNKVLERRDILSENEYLRRTLQSRYKFENIIGSSEKMQEVFRLVSQVASTNSTVLIRGESGTGKELVARAIHFNSARKNKRFMPVDCGALSDELLESELFGHLKGAFTGAVTAKKGVFEVADGGTLFLDEIGNTSLRFQTKLLRVLQEREFMPVGGTKTQRTDVRLIVATNKDLETMVAEGRFREELFYRLNIVPIEVPPLRERREDIPSLARHFLRKFSQDTGRPVTKISSRALTLLVNYDWPGNVRELENAIHRAVVLATGDTVRSSHLPPNILGARHRLNINVPQTNEELKAYKKELREKSVEEVERLFVVEALRRNDWNVTHAAANVGMQRSNFQLLMRKYDVKLTGPQDTAKEEGKPEQGAPEEPLAPEQSA